MELEIIILQRLQDIRTPLMDAIMQSLTIMGDLRFLLIILALVYWCMDKKIGKYLAWTTLFSATLNLGIKEIVRRPRPYEVGRVKPAVINTSLGYAFPSGHTQAVTSFWGGAMSMFNNKAFKIVGCLMIAIVGFSRIYLGVHWPSDVVFGIVVGIVAILISNRLYDSDKVFSRRAIGVVGIISVVVLLLPVTFYSARVVGALLGFIGGGYVEEQFIKFKDRVSGVKQFQKVIVGLLGVVAIYMLSNVVVEAFDYKIVYMLNGVLLTFWIMAGAPYVFRNISK